MLLSDCVFCEIVNGTAPAEIDWWDTENEAVVFKPLNPVAAGHRLVVPFAHVADFAESPNTTAAVMRSAAMFAHRSDQACNLITSKGAAATQSVFHLHVHIVPRWTGDQLMLPWGTTGNPHAPHWCAVAQRLQDQINAQGDDDANHEA